MKYRRVRIRKYYQYAKFPLGFAGDQREVSIFESTFKVAVFASYYRLPSTSDNYGRL